jgi:hypothetical protein
MKDIVDILRCVLCVDRIEAATLEFLETFQPITNDQVNGCMCCCCSDGCC